MGTDEGSAPGLLVTQMFLRIYLSFNYALVCASVYELYMCLLCAYAYVSVSMHVHVWLDMICVYMHI